MDYNNLKMTTVPVLNYKVCIESNGRTYFYDEAQHKIVQVEIILSTSDNGIVPRDVETALFKKLIEIRDGLQ